MKIHFHKYHGAGNDFILMDNRLVSPIPTEEQIRALCHRRFGIGADGFMLLSSPTAPPYRFSMRYYNADGAEAAMCGNGGRCIAAFAHHLGIDNLLFTAVDGPHLARIVAHNPSSMEIELGMKDAEQPALYKKGMYVLNTGSPHLVVAVGDVDRYDVEGRGCYWRRHGDFPEGINVNFVETLAPGLLKVRTYERGVEAETWACGTGATASALTAAHNCDNRITSWEVLMRGGRLKVTATPVAGGYRHVILSGPAAKVFEGEVEI